MTRHRLLAVGVVALLSLTAQARAALQYVLVLCTTNQCEYRVAASVTIGGRSSVRLARAPLDVVSPSALGGFPEAKFDRIAGLYRDPQSGIVYELGPDALRRDIALPQRLAGKETIAPGLVWQGTAIEYVAVGAKTKAAVTLSSFAYLLVSNDAEQSVFELLQRLINRNETDPRRALLIRGALQFNAKPPTVQKWRNALLGRIRDQIQRFDRQAGDPSTLADALHEAVELRAVYPQVSDDKANKDMFDHVAAADDLFARRLAIADALRAAALWDEYLAKLHQLGLAKWSMPEALAHEREALAQSARLHQDRSIAFAKDGHFDRAFDEIELAAHNSCDPAVLDNFSRARTTLVNRNKIASSLEYSGSQKTDLEQIVRGLEQLDPAKEQVTLDRIRQGEAIDPNFLPLQWKKVEFLDKLGKYTEALAVLQRIERTVPLDPKQLELCLGLDGRITNNLLDAIQKSRDDTRKAFEEGRYQDTLVAAARGLKADPTHAGLLYYSAMSAAFLRQGGAAMTYIRAYLGDANVTCAPASEPEKMLDLYRLIATPVVRQDQTDGIPNWVSGVRYRLQEAPYDPISLAFLQPITRIVSKDGGMSTVFNREGRSFLVSSILTQRLVTNAAPGSTGASTILFDAEPKYDRQTLSMLEISPISTSASTRTANRLTYLSSPLVDPGLVLKFAGRQIARGWAGNPFFHPLVWNGFYVFDLTYDRLGRVVSATPISEEAGFRTDPFSEPLQFTWSNDTNLLLSVQGKNSGYLRQLRYDDTRLLVSETISYPPNGGKGQIQYYYREKSAELQTAKCADNFWDRLERIAYFDGSMSKGR
jgi:hypothetical protein